MLQNFDIVLQWLPEKREKSVREENDRDGSGQREEATILEREGLVQSS